ncbi:MAG: hypothetical protein JST75_04030 [Bacteroidetes bacterium]|nr:hypothetical protein [Bacteroidota bacterium]
MTISQKITFKNQLKQIGLDIINARIAMSKKNIDNAQEAANSEEKSSAGDKYETGRAMSHLEKDMHARQMSEHIKDLALLREINTDIIYDTCSTGAFIKCKHASFFIAAGLGKQNFDNTSIFFLSPYAPLAKLLKEKKASDEFVFNEVRFEIIDVF